MPEDSSHNVHKGHKENSAGASSSNRPLMIRFIPSLRCASPKLIRSPSFNPAQPELREDLLRVNGHQRFHRFELCDDFPIYNDVGSKSFIKTNVVVYNRHRFLALSR